MSPFLYLFIKKTKNRFFEFIRKPLQLLGATAVILFVGFTFYTSAVSNPPESTFRDKNEFFALVFALYTFAFIMSARNGFINGASMFSMADVNLLFTSPLKEKKILTYGLVQQLGKSLTLGFFILYQSGTVNNIYGLNISAVFPVLIGYSATVFLGQMTAALIYSITCSDDKKCLKGKILFYGIFALLFTCLLSGSFKNGFSLESLVSACQNKILFFFPVSGFISFAVRGAVNGELSYVIWGIIIFIILCFIYYIVTAKINKDFYEDVLKATQISFSAITAKKEGKAYENTPKNIKTGKTGLGKGYGASAISIKHRKENKRSNRLYLSSTSLITILFSLAYCFIIPDETFMLFTLNVYTASMSVCTGRWAKEFSYPYIYLIPEKSFRKLLYLIKEDLPSLIIESLLCFIPLTIFTSYDFLQSIAMVMARFTFGLVFIGVNLLLQKLFGDSEKKIFAMISYMVLVIVISAPSIAAGIFIGTLLPFNYELAFMFMSILNSVISFLLFYNCRNLLEYSEYNNR